MSEIRISDLPPDDTPSSSDVVAVDGVTTRQSTLQQIVYAGRPAASTAQAEAGTDDDAAMTPLKTKQSIAAEIGGTIVTQAQAVPAGGTTGQVLGKVSAADNDVEWQNPGAGDVLAANDLSDLASVGQAKTNLGFGALSITADTTVNVPEDITAQEMASHMRYWFARPQQAIFSVSGPQFVQAEVQRSQNASYTYEAFKISGPKDLVINPRSTESDKAVTSISSTLRQSIVSGTGSNFKMTLSYQARHENDFVLRLGGVDKTPGRDNKRDYFVCPDFKTVVFHDKLVGGETVAIVGGAGTETFTATANQYEFVLASAGASAAAVTATVNGTAQTRTSSTSVDFILSPDKTAVYSRSFWTAGVNNVVATHFVDVAVTLTTASNASSFSPGLYAKSTIIGNGLDAKMTRQRAGRVVSANSGTGVVTIRIGWRHAETEAIGMYVSGTLRPINHGLFVQLSGTSDNVGNAFLIDGDVVLGNIFVAPVWGFQWATATAYTVDRLLTDATSGDLYRCLVAHTSGGGTFAADRAANPTYWSVVTGQPDYHDTNGMTGSVTTTLHCLLEGVPKHGAWPGQLRGGDAMYLAGIIDNCGENGLYPVRGAQVILNGGASTVACGQNWRPSGDAYLQISGAYSYGAQYAGYAADGNKARAEGSSSTEILCSGYRNVRVTNGAQFIASGAIVNNSMRVIAEVAEGGGYIDLGTASLSGGDRLGAGDLIVDFGRDGGIIKNVVSSAWAVSTGYSVGNVRIDATDSTRWQALVAHTSGAGTFAADRAANPSYWISALPASTAIGFNGIPFTVNKPGPNGGYIQTLDIDIAHPIVGAVRQHEQITILPGTGNLLDALDDARTWNNRLQILLTDGVYLETMQYVHRQAVERVVQGSGFYSTVSGTALTVDSGSTGAWVITITTSAAHGIAAGAIGYFARVTGVVGSSGAWEAVSGGWELTAIPDTTHLTFAHKYKRATFAPVISAASIRIYKSRVVASGSAIGDLFTWRSQPDAVLRRSDDYAMFDATAPGLVLRDLHIHSDGTDTDTTGLFASDALGGAGGIEAHTCLITNFEYGAAALQKGSVYMPSTIIANCRAYAARSLVGGIIQGASGIASACNAGMQNTAGTAYYPNFLSVGHTGSGFVNEDGGVMSVPTTVAADCGGVGFLGRRGSYSALYNFKSRRNAGHGAQFTRHARFCWDGAAGGNLSQDNLSSGLVLDASVGSVDDLTLSGHSGSFYDLAMDDGSHIDYDTGDPPVYTTYNVVGNSMVNGGVGINGMRIKSILHTQIASGSYTNINADSKKINQVSTPGTKTGKTSYSWGSNSVTPDGIVFEMHCLADDTTDIMAKNTTASTVSVTTRTFDIVATIEE